MTTNSVDWDEDLPPETEAEVYRALLRALQRKQGFGLFFVQCSEAQGEKIVRDLRQDLPQQRIQVLPLQGEVTTLYDQVNALWQQEPFDVLVVEGLQASLYAYEDTKRLSGWSSSEIYNYSWKGVPKLLSHLNQQREHFRDDFPARFVFLVPPFVVDYFIQRAADFIDWRSGLFRFPRKPHEIRREADRFVSGGDYDQYLTLSPQERVEKILAIKTSLQEIENTSKNKIPESQSLSTKVQGWVGKLLNHNLLTSDIERQKNLLHEMGLLFDAGQDYENAIISWEKALKLNPKFYEAWCNRGIAFYFLGRNEEAIDNFEQALKIAPNSYAVYSLKGDALSNLGRYREAIDCYNQALKLEPNSHSIWLQLGLILSTLERHEEAIESFDRVIQLKPDSYTAFYARGLSLRTLERNEEAFDSFEQAIRIEPDDFNSWNDRGVVLHALGHYDEALDSFGQALEIEPDSYEVWNNLGSMLNDIGYSEDALYSFDQALETSPGDHYYIWSNRGFTLLDLRRYEEAIESFDQALKIEPDNHVVFWFKGFTLHILGCYRDAIANFDQALKLKLDLYEAWLFKGISLNLLGNYGEALLSYDQAIQLKPANADVYYRKACCYGLQRQVGEAISHLQYAIKLDAEYREMAKTDTDFDPIRHHPHFRALIEDDYNGLPIKINGAQ